MKKLNPFNDLKRFKQNNLNDFLYLNQEVIIKISLDNKDLTSVITKNLISLEVVDNLAFSADTLSFKLHDDGVALPKKGAWLNLSLGFKNNPYLFRSFFVVDELSLSGVPDVLEIKASSANLRGELNIKRNKVYDDLSLGDLVASVAARHGLKYSINSELAAQHIIHLDQTEESDTSFLIRILEDFGSALAIKQNNLLIFKIGAPLTINGKTMPPVVINRNDTLNFSFNIFDRGNYTGCRAYYLDYNQTLNNGNNSVLVGEATNVKNLNYTFKTKANALRAAKAHLINLKRAACSFSINLATARPDLIPGMSCAVKGFKNAIDSDTWQIVRITHQINKNSGFVSSLDLEKQF